MAGYTVVLTSEIHPKARALLEAVATVRVCPAIDPDSLRAGVADADALLVRHMLPKDILEHGPKLRILARHGVGLDFIPVAEATQKGVLVSNAPGSNTQGVVEHTIGAMLSLARRYCTLDAAVREGDWGIRNTLTAFELAGRSLGVLGLGKIGMSVATAAHFGFGMRIMGYDPFCKRFPPHITPASVGEIFRECDCISLHVPLTEDTRGMVNTDLLNTMKPGALLVNACRGEVVVEEDLVTALQTGPLGGAALDVFPEEPLPQNHPYCSLPNVLLTPHSAALTEESILRMGEMSCGDIVRVLSGEKPLHGVNMEAWPAFAAKYGAAL